MHLFPSHDQKQEQVKQQKQQQEYQQFFEYFASENERSFDPAKDTIPDEVWQQVQNGKPLLDAYQAHEARSLKARLKELEIKLTAQETNIKNEEASTGSLTGNGGTASDFIDAATFEKHKDDRNWIIKNLSKIQKSRAKW